VAGRCAFADRCDWAADACRAAKPPLREAGAGRLTACLRRDEIAEEMRALRRRAFEDPAAAPAVAAVSTPLVRVSGLLKNFHGRRGRLVRALKGVTIEIGPGESVGLVGESGSGKTTLGRCLVGLETPTAGEIDINGIDAADYAKLTRVDRTRLRRSVQIVFQDPYSSLDPTETVGAALREVLVVNDYPAE